MTTERQLAYIVALAQGVGVDPQTLLERSAEAGRCMHHATNAAFLTRAWDAGRRTVNSLQTREASRLIQSILGARNRDNPAIGLYDAEEHRLLNLAVEARRQKRRGSSPCDNASRPKGMTS